MAKDANFWNKVVLSHKKVFRSRFNGQIRIYRPRNARYDPTRSATSSGMLLHVEERLNRHVYVRILENAMPPSLSRIFPDHRFIFQQDNCSVHTARKVQDWFRNHNINDFCRNVCLPTPKRSTKVIEVSGAMTKY